VLLGVCVALPALNPGNPTVLATYWSPYQKLVLSEKASRIGKYLITVNNVGYQAMVDSRDEEINAHPRLYPAALRGCSQYDLPALLHASPRKMLIVGAGSGNDASGALRNGVEDVTAVEIDPAIIALGERYHPEQPYSSPRVHVVTDDARSFFAKTSKRFDVIVFGLLDSHTTTALTNNRLDHYVYTRESIAQARRLLEPGGVLVMSFAAQKSFIADRLARVLRDVFGQDPLIFRVPASGFGWGGVHFVTGDLEGVRRQLAARPQLGNLISVWRRLVPYKVNYTTDVATDDWPYLYLEGRSIPVLYYLLGALLLVLLLRFRMDLRLGHVTAGWGASHLHFFFLGAAFLLLEMQNISKAAVVLGNTWMVNAVIVSSVLIMVLLSNALAARFPRLPLELVYVALCGSCLALYFVDIARFAFLPYLTKSLVVGTLTTLPMLFSGIVFIRSFLMVAAKHTALGANMIGSLVGGVLQSVTFVTGVRALLLIVAGLYGLAWLTRPRQEVVARPSGLTDVPPSPGLLEPGGD
jgi:spermidine synthase